ncbi:MAG TPA: GNAT family N-acetyltransferase [Solirubrobacterales bacterium]|jgi:GNAT superfamily N-acetyltransferase
MSPPRRVAEQADLEAIAETLARAFERYPVWQWAFEPEPDRASRLAGMRAVFGFCAGAALACGWVRVSDGVEAVALWIPPGEAEMSPADAERFPALVRASVGTEQTADRILAAMEAFERTQPTGPPHYFLDMLGTHPDHAGHGYGRALLGANLEEIDAAGAPAFLETSSPANIPRYERLGFRVEREVDLLAGLSTTQMWRPPGGAPT